MKFSVSAGELAAAISLAALVRDDKSGVEGLKAAHVKAADGAVAITTNILDHAMTVSCAAEIDQGGEAAVRASALAGLAAGFDADAAVALESTARAVVVKCGRGRYRLSVIPLENLPALPAITDATGAVELDGDEALRLFTVPAFAISDETARNYLNGLCLHHTEGGLTAVATDGHRLCRIIVPAATVLSNDRKLIVPTKSVELITKLLKKTAPASVALRRSRVLLEIKAPRFTFISKLIDAEFPDYERLIPLAKSLPSSATVDRKDLAHALDRLAAVADDQAPIVALVWNGGDDTLQLTLPRQPDCATDEIAAELAGRGQVAAQLRYLVELTDEIKVERLQLRPAAGAGPILVGDPANDRLLILQLPVCWNFQKTEAAA